MAQQRQPTIKGILKAYALYMFSDSYGCQQMDFATSPEDVNCR